MAPSLNHVLKFVIFSPVPTSLLVTKVNTCIKQIFQAEEFRHAEEIWLGQWDIEEFV